MLDFSFSTDYYLRIIELSIRDSRLYLSYDEKMQQLVPLLNKRAFRRSSFSEDQILITAFNKLIDHDNKAYISFVRFVSVIDNRIEEERRWLNRWWCRWICRDCDEHQQVVDKLLTMKTLLQEALQKSQSKIMSVFYNGIGKQCLINKKEYAYTCEAEGAYYSLKDLMAGVVEVKKNEAFLISTLMTFLLSNSQAANQVKFLLLEKFLSSALDHQDIHVEESEDKLMRYLLSLTMFSFEDFCLLVKELVQSLVTDRKPVWRAVEIGLQSNQGRGVLGLWEQVYAHNYPAFKNSQVVIGKFFLETLRNESFSYNKDDEIDLDAQEAFLFIERVVNKDINMDWLVGIILDSWLWNHRESIETSLSESING